MATELKAYCVHCGGPMAFPPELQGQNIVCPHCNILTTLGQPAKAPATPFHPGLYGKSTASIKSKSEFVGMGCLVQLIGLGVIWVFPVGTVVGILLLIIGGRMAIKLICSQCGNPVTNKQVKICPSCQAAFSK